MLKNAAGESSYKGNTIIEVAAREHIVRVVTTNIKEKREHLTIVMFSPEGKGGEIRLDEALMLGAL